MSVTFSEGQKLPFILKNPKQTLFEVKILSNINLNFSINTSCFQAFPTPNIVTQFNVENDESYSIYYDWQSKLNENTYVRRLNNDGLWEDVYAPSISSKNDQCETRPQDLNWWTKVTEYPITATITIKGLLRPAILMTYVRLNVYFYGQKHINSGLYIVTKQLDTIDSRGYRTQLSLTRIAGDTQ